MHEQIEGLQIKNTSKTGKSKMPAKLFYIFTIPEVELSCS